MDGASDGIHAAATPIKILATKSIRTLWLPPRGKVGWLSSE